MGTAREDGVTKLYSYQTIDHLEENLRSNRIHCSTPANFNDPWDCKPYLRPPPSMTLNSAQKWITFFKGWFRPEEQKVLAQQLGPEWYENDSLLQSIASTTLNVWQNNTDRYALLPHHEADVLADVGALCE